MKETQWWCLLLLGALRWIQSHSPTFMMRGLRVVPPTTVGLMAIVVFFTVSSMYSPGFLGAVALVPGK